MRLTPVLACLAAFPLTLSSLVAAHADPVEIVANPAAAGGDVTDITIREMSYSTPNVKVKRGAIVRWKNQDDVAHNVQLRGGPAKGWDKAQGPMLNKDQAYALKFNEPGQYKYICTPHSMVMKGQVDVE